MNPRRFVFAFATTCMLGCSSTTLSEVDRLAEASPVAYSVLVSGGAFLEVDSRVAAPESLSRTWPQLAVGVEAFPLNSVLEVLRAARTFVAIELDPSPVEARQALAKLTTSVPVRSRESEEVFAIAREHGHDLVLVVERLRDGGIEERGINDQWPITAVAWLALGLGVLIPDHTYESRASLRVALREVQTGELIFQSPLSAGPVDLTLWERGSFLGLVTSILVPPFLVGDDRTSVVDRVRELSTRRLLVSIARQMKSQEVRERIGERLPATILVTSEGGRIQVQVEARESIAVARVRLGGVALDGEAARSFEAALLASETQQGGRWRYAAPLAASRGSTRVQVIVQTVSGRVASVTVPIGERP